MMPRAGLVEHFDVHPGLRAAAVAWILMLGAVVGSFLNVVIARVPRGRSVVRPRSSCPACGAPIAWYDNVPILSWIFLRARCRACGARISFRYPLVEALGAAAALLAFARHGPAGAAAAELAFAAALVALAFIDLDTWLLPHAITWPLIGAGILAAVVGWSASGDLASSLLGAGAGFAAFALVAVLGARIFRREALGWGDVWLLAGIGAWLGPRALIPVVLLASLQGSVFGLALLALGRGQPGPPPAEPAAPPGDSREGVPPVITTPAPASERDWVPPRNAVPFGPFLALGALEWLYLGVILSEHVPVLSLFR
jgi:leader peptidase (prepilin peptidase)/N-methyltransferase